jgi:protein-S-isoprenylcysteine O-methyltransferase Ste14
MTDSTLFNVALIGVFVMVPITVISLLMTTAQYGRHNHSTTPGPKLPTRIAWVYMESPSVFAFAYFFFSGANATQTVPLVLLLMWQAHYIQRTLIYPLQMRVREGDNMPLLIASSGFAFNVVNSFLNGSWIATYGSYDLGWLSDPRFIIGVVVYLVGYVVNRQSDSILRELRKPGESGYKIPQGGLYRWVSSPNYFGELMIWGGWAIATWSLAGLSFFAYTAANLVPRAIAHHRWYRKQFEEYPAERRAVIPYVL